MRASLERDEVRTSGCVVFTGSGRAFSAGADVNELGGSAEDVIAYYRETGGVYERVAALPQPTVSAIAGYCLGAGLELALATDFRIADETAVFGFPEVGIGILPSSGGTHRLARLVGRRPSQGLILLRERFGGSLEPEARSSALEAARTLADLPALAVSIAKQAIDAMPEASREAGILIERLAYGLLAQTEDAARWRLMWEKPIEIRWRDLDSSGHVNNAVYLTYLEEVRTGWLAQVLGAQAVPEFVLARVAFDYRRELTLADRTVVARCACSASARRASARARRSAPPGVSSPRRQRSSSRGTKPAAPRVHSGTPSARRSSERRPPSCPFRTAPVPGTVKNQCQARARKVRTTRRPTCPL